MSCSDCRQWNAICRSFTERFTRERKKSTTRTALIDLKSRLSHVPTKLAFMTLLLRTHKHTHTHTKIKLIFMLQLANRACTISWTIKRSVVCCVMILLYAINVPKQAEERKKAGDGGQFPSVLIYCLAAFEHFCFTSWQHQPMPSFTTSFFVCALRIYVVLFLWWQTDSWP